METGHNEIIVEAQVHENEPTAPVEPEGRTTRGRGRPPKNVSQTQPASQNVQKPKKPTKSQGGGSGPKRLTVNALADRMTIMEEALDSRVSILEREIQNTNSVLKGVGDTLKQLVAALPSNNDTPVQISCVPAAPVTPEAPAPLPVRTAVNTVVAGQPPSETHSVHPSSRPPLTSGPQPAPALPPPAILVREQNQDGHLDRAMAREEYKAGASRGKHHSFNELGMAKPYMFVFREGLQTVKQKLDIRASLSMLEYLNSTLLLLQDPDAFSPDDLPHILFHLSAVTTDAMVRPWHAVRTWSQYVWDCVERDKCRWDSYQFIHNERVRMCFISGAPSGSNASSSIPQKSIANDVRSVLCREYNSISGCRHHGTHEEQGVKYLHACSHCDSIGRCSAHSYPRCRSKFEGNTQSSYHNHDQRQWNQGHGRQQYGQHTSDGNHGGQVAYRNGPGSQGNSTSKNM